VPGGLGNCLPRFAHICRVFPLWRILHNGDFASHFQTGNLPSPGLLVEQRLGRAATRRAGPPRAGGDGRRSRFDCTTSGSSAENEGVCAMQAIKCIAGGRSRFHCKTSGSSAGNEGVCAMQAIQSFPRNYDNRMVVAVKRRPGDEPLQKQERRSLLDQEPGAKPATVTTLPTAFRCKVTKVAKKCCVC
jgi:hypothetical protein